MTLPVLEPGAGRSAAILARLQTLYPQLIDLSLGRIEALLSKLGNPEQHLPPVIHVAGTNGKGSTCAFLRAIGETAGWRVHVTTSPHLVSLTERFRVAGKLVSEDELRAALEDIERINDGAAITVFEVLAACGFVLFARHPADLCVVEVGLGGRFDATNVVHPLVAAIASISMDHRDFLGDTLEKIAWEKAGIIKPGAPAVTVAQNPDVMAVLWHAAEVNNTVLFVRGQDWDICKRPESLVYQDSDGKLHLPLPSLTGAHQIENAGLAIAALRVSGLTLAANDFSGIARAVWPARMQPLHGNLARGLKPGFSLYLDGGHNEGAGEALAKTLAGFTGQPLYLLVGMKKSKDAGGFLRPLLPLAAKVFAVREPAQHLAAEIADIMAASGGIAVPGPDVRQALAQVAGLPPGRVVICGSLYLAGEVLRADGFAGD